MVKGRQVLDPGLELGLKWSLATKSMMTTSTLVV